MRLRLNAHGVPGLTVIAGRDGSDLVEVEAAANTLIPVVIRAPSGAAAPWFTPHYRQRPYGRADGAEDQRR